MALIELTLEGKIDKVKKAISRIQAYAFDVPVAAISGGKLRIRLDRVEMIVDDSVLERSGRQNEDWIDRC